MQICSYHVLVSTTCKVARFLRDGSESREAFFRGSTMSCGAVKLSAEYLQLSSSAADANNGKHPRLDWAGQLRLLLISG